MDGDVTIRGVKQPSPVYPNLAKLSEDTQGLPGATSEREMKDAKLLGKR